MRARVLLRGAHLLAAAICAAAVTAGAADARPARQSPAAEAGWWHPPARLTWYWQLTGTINNTRAVAAYDIDGFENGPGEVALLHAKGIHVICYISVGTAENWRPDFGLFPKSVIGRKDGNWPGEYWLDVRALGVLEPIMAARLRMCREKGFDAVEPDNIEAYANRSGFPLTAGDQLAYNRWVAEAAHSLGMAILQKNDGEQTAQLRPYFDGALSEECNQFRECALFAPYIAAGEPVLNAEYKLARSRFCASDATAGIMGARYNLALNGRRFEPCV